MTIAITRTFQHSNTGRSADFTPETGEFYIWRGCTLLADVHLPADTPDPMIFDLIITCPETKIDFRGWTRMHEIMAAAFNRLANAQLRRIDEMLIKR